MRAMNARKAGDTPVSGDLVVDRRIDRKACEELAKEVPSARQHDNTDPDEAALESVEIENRLRFSRQVRPRLSRWTTRPGT
jgi:hypothetical protein